MVLAPVQAIANDRSSIKVLDKPNILWITSEDNSAYWLGCYGNLLAKTPNIDQLATEGIRYTHASANALVCAPAVKPCEHASALKVKFD